MSKTQDVINDLKRLDEGLSSHPPPPPTAHLDGTQLQGTVSLLIASIEELEVAKQKTLELAHRLQAMINVVPATDEAPLETELDPEVEVVPEEGEGDEVPEAG